MSDHDGEYPAPIPLCLFFAREQSGLTANLESRSHAQLERSSSGQAQQFTVTQQLRRRRQKWLNKLFSFAIQQVQCSMFKGKHKMQQK